MNCIAVEDEPAAQFILKQYIERCPGLTCLGIFHDAIAAGEFLDVHSADLLFLDINLPEISGISFLHSLVHPPMVIFTTAYPQYALDGFDLQIVDFLLKPFSYERFCEAVSKAGESLNSNGAHRTAGKITVKSDKKIYRISLDEIHFIEASGDYISFHFSGRKLLVHGTLKEWEEKLKGEDFMRVHRTIVINLQKIDHIEGNRIISGKYRLPLANSCKGPLTDRIFTLR